LNELLDQAVSHEDCEKTKIRDEISKENRKLIFIFDNYIFQITNKKSPNPPKMKQYLD
jgi:hypothetical protein